MNRWLLTTSILLTAAFASGACGNETSLFGTPAVGGMGGDGAGAAGGTTSSSSSTSGGGTTSSGGGVGGNGGQGGGQGGGGGGACSADAVGVALRPLDMVLIVDLSASVYPKWSAMVTALADFANASRPLGTSLAFNYNPTPASNQYCEVGYYNPLQTPLTLIPSGAGSLITDLNSQTPAGPSPWSSALEGSLAFATSYQYQHTDHVVVNVLMADSNPNNCNTDFNHLAGLASSAHNLNGVRTYVIGLEGLQPLTGATQVAQAGGTAGAVDLTAQGATSQLTSVLEQIRDASIPCEYDIPPNPGGPLVPAEVNLSYTPGGTGTPQDVLQVSGSGACGANSGWTFDDPSAPTMIMLCPTTCNTIKQDLSPLVEVLFGCPTLKR